jgi:multidrug efflux pump
MNISAIFIRRPIGTILLTLGIVLGGVLAFRSLPVAPLPNIDFPVVVVQATLPGASPTTMATSVAVPLERHLQTIAGLDAMTSQSQTGQTQVILQFSLSRNINGAARDVQAAINAARADLPTTLKANPTYFKANPASQPVIFLALTSETRAAPQIYDAVSSIVVQKLSQVEGVGDVELGGASLPATRIEVNPLALARYGISLEDVRVTLTATNANRPKGIIDSNGQSFQIYSNKPSVSAKDFQGLVIAWRNGRAVRLSDIANVYDGPEDARNMGIYNGKRAVMVLISRQPGANIVRTVDSVKAQLNDLKALMPADIHLEVASDSTTSIRASLRDVERALGFATLLVVLVVSVFLRTWQSTIIPGIAVVVSLAGTVGMMALLGYSLNNFSLMGLTVATGFVVDDAIVVLENITRYVEKGMAPMEAALKGTKEVGFTIISISISLVAVFIPLLFSGGIPGKLMAEFAVTITLAVMISLVIALTTAPMLASVLLRPHDEHREGRFHRLSVFAEKAFDRVLAGYTRSLDWALGNRPAVLLMLLGSVFLTGVIVAKVPKGFMPEQDNGSLQGGLRADRSISFDTMSSKLTQIVDIVRADPAVKGVIAFTGGRRAGGGFLFASLKPIAERDSARTVIARLRPKLAPVTGVSVFLNPSQDAQGGARGGNALFQYTLQADSIDALKTATLKLTEAMKRDKAFFTDVDPDLNDSASETYVHIDPQRAAQLGLDNRTIDNILYDGFGQRQVSVIYSGINQYHVVLGVDPSFEQSPDALANVYLPVGGTANTTGVSGTARTMTRLQSLASWSVNSAESEINHQDGSPSATISFNMAGAKAISDAAVEIDRLEAELEFPASVHGGFAGTAKNFGDTFKSLPFLIIAALAIIYFVLGILYEDLVHPITVLSTLPSAALGGALGLLVGGIQFDIIAIVALLLLIGIVKKNAIMMIDFALIGERERGLTPAQAIREAALLRFRPILMTTLAAGFGALPLAIGYGDGAELRRPLGVVIIGGLIASQMISLLTTPVVYLALDRLRSRKGRTRMIKFPAPAAQTGAVQL